MPTKASATGGPGSMRANGQMLHASAIKWTPEGFTSEYFTAGTKVLKRVRFMAGKITATIAAVGMTAADVMALFDNATVDIQWLNGHSESFKGCDLTSQSDEGLEEGTFDIEFGYTDRA